jgi:hypothetical protein
MADLGKAYVQIIPKAEGISGKIKEQIAPGAKQAGTDAGTNIAGNIKKVLAGAAIGATVVKGFQMALDAGGKLQQSFGGLETLYGDAADAAKKYAAEAAQAGISANDYAEQAVSFGASLKAAFGGDTAKAAEAANTAIMDMADNAAKMGTPLENIQNAYQGFAKGNYTMLDNLKLGYGGTKTEMERLLADAQKLTGVEYNIDNLGDVYDAVHAIQDNLGLTGVAAQEAATTFSGSFGAMKAAAENVLANLSTGGDVEGSMQQLAQSAGTFLFDNLIPMVGNVVSAIPGALGSFISTAAPLIAEQGKAIIDNLIGANGQPDIITRAGEIISNIISGITQKIQDFATIAPEIMSTIATGITNAIPTVIEKGSEIINGIRDSLAENIPILWESATTIVSNIAEKIAEAYPTIIEKGAELISTIADAIVEHLPDLASSAVDIINSIGDFLAENIPTLASKVAEFMSNMGRTIVTNIPVVVGAIAKAAPTVLSAIGRIGLSIIQNIIKLIPKIASAGLQIISGLARGMGGAALGLVKTAMDNIKKAIEKPIQDAKDTLSGILDGIKGFFPISIGKILDNISLPHFTVDGGEFPYGVGGKGHMPSFGVDWYAKAMDQPYMFNRASLIGVGEAGDEMVYGRKALMDDIREAAGGGRNVTINVTVNGTDNPEQWATRLVRQMELEVRTA